jgi:hypothetical protein
MAQEVEGNFPVVVVLVVELVEPPKEVVLGVLEVLSGFQVFPVVVEQYNHKLVEALEVPQVMLVAEVDTIETG